MKKSALTSQLKDPDSAILIVDKIGVIGEKLAEEFSKDFYVVLFSGRFPAKLSKRISFVNFKNKIPKVPQNRYSKIFLIDDGKSITKETSFSFIKEARTLNADFYFLGSVRNFDIKHTDELVNFYDKSKILVFGDLFDKKFLFDHDASITKYILEAGNKKKIKVPGEGLSLSYPIGFDDTIKLILKAVYLKIPEKIILLFYKSPITDMSLAHIFQKIDPEIKIDFEKEFRNLSFFIPEGSEYAISKYDLKQRIEELNLDEPKTFLYKNKKIKKNNLKYPKFLGITFLLLLFLLALPFFTTHLYLSMGEKQLNDSIKYSERFEYSNALKKSNNANSLFSFSQSSNRIFLKQLDLINKTEIGKNVSIKIQNGLTLSKTMDNVFKSAVLFEQIYSNNSITADEDFNKLLIMIKGSYVDLEKIDINNPIINLNMMISSIGFLAKISDVLPEVLGFTGEKSYLVLIQDSSELRPGGGKITSIAKLKINDSVVSEIEIIDTNEQDEELNIHIEPPFAVRRYLPSIDYYLKDSNFEPDFVESAITASAIYNITSNDEMDGVIGVDLYFLEYLLQKVGPIYIKDFEKNITAENIHQMASEYEYIEGNDSFTTILLKEIKIKLSEKKNISPFVFLEIIEKATKEKHMLFAFKNNEVQNVFITNNLAGSLKDKRTSSENKINDTLGIYEANLGLNKINYYMSRSVSKKNIIDKNGEISSEVTIAFKNSSKRGSSYAKTYKNYIQVILPNNVNLSDVSIAGKNQDLIPAINDYKVYENPRFSNPKELEIDQITDLDKSLFGFLISIAPDSIQTVKLNYSLPIKISTTDNATNSYSLLIFKQPGIESFPFSLVFEENSDFDIAPQNSYSLEIKSDEIVNSIISKK